MSSDDDDRPPNQLHLPLSHFQSPHTSLISSSMATQPPATARKPYQITFATRDEEIRYLQKLQTLFTKYNGDSDRLTTWLRETAALLDNEGYPESDHPYIIRHLLTDDALDFYTAHE